MKKIIILALHLNVGGIEKCISYLSRMLCDDFEVEIISLYRIEDKPAFDIPQKVKIKYLTDYKPNRKEFIDAVKKISAVKIISEGIKSFKILFLKKNLIKKSIKHCDADIIISTRIDFSELLAKSNRKDVIKVIHEHVYHNKNKKYIKRIGKILNTVDYLLPSSEYLKKDYQIFFPEYKGKIQYLKWPVEKNKVKSSNKNFYKLISVGRLSPEKGFFDLIDVFEKVQKECPEVRLFIVGDGVENKSLQKYVNEKKINGITFTGFLTGGALTDLYSSSSIFIMTSFEESFGLVLLEAASYGLPLVAFDTALGAKEIIGEKFGVLVKNRDKEIMTKNIINLLNEEEKYKKYSQASNERASEFYFDKVKNSHIEFYKKISM